MWNSFQSNIAIPQVVCAVALAILLIHTGVLNILWHLNFVSFIIHFLTFFVCLLDIFLLLLLSVRKANERSSMKLSFLLISAADFISLTNKKLSEKKILYTELLLNYKRVNQLIKWHQFKFKQLFHWTPKMPSEWSVMWCTLYTSSIPLKV